MGLSCRQLAAGCIKSTDSLLELNICCEEILISEVGVDGCRKPFCCAVSVIIMNVYNDCLYYEQLNKGPVERAVM